MKYTVISKSLHNLHYIRYISFFSNPDPSAQKRFLFELKEGVAVPMLFPLKLLHMKRKKIKAKTSHQHQTFHEILKMVTQTNVKDVMPI